MQWSKNYNTKIVIDKVVGKKCRFYCSIIVLTQCGLMNPHDNIDLGQRWHRLWFVVWRQQATTWTNIDLSSVRPCDIHLRTQLQADPRIVINVKRVHIKNCIQIYQWPTGYDGGTFCIPSLQDTHWRQSIIVVGNKANTKCGMWFIATNVPKFLAMKDNSIP